MEKHCSNHPESMAVATCKACSKSVCLMCVSDEKEGTFCSPECHAAFVSGAPVSAAQPAAAPGGDVIGSIFDAEPPPPSTSLNLPAGDGPEPIVAEGTKWRPIGAKCENHGDTDAVANCDRCGKAVCPLCLLEAAAGTFCSSECMTGTGSAAPAAEARVLEEAAPPPPPPRPAPAPRPPAPVPQRSAPVNVMATGKVHKKSGGTIAAAILLLLLAGGGYFGYDYWEKNLRPGTQDPSTSLVTPPLPPVKPPPVVEPPKPPPPDPVKIPVVEPPKPPPVKPPVEPPKPEPPPPPVRRPVKREAPPVVRQTRIFNPWGAEEVGSWYRTRTVRGGEITYTDQGVKERAEHSVTLYRQTCTNGKPGPVTEVKAEPQTVFLGGERTFTFDERPFLCELRQYSADPAAPKYWTQLQGRHVGAVLQAETPEGTLTATRVWEHDVRLNRRSFDSLVVEAEIEKDGAKRKVKTWYSGQYLIGPVREEREGVSTALVDWGLDWSKRTAFPSP
jgi:hypothetical protein